MWYNIKRGEKVKVENGLEISSSGIFKHDEHDTINLEPTMTETMFKKLKEGDIIILKTEKPPTCNFDDRFHWIGAFDKYVNKQLEVLKIETLKGAVRVKPMPTFGLHFWWFYNIIIRDGEAIRE